MLIFLTCCDPPVEGISRPDIRCLMLFTSTSTSWCLLVNTLCGVFCGVKVLRACAVWIA